MRRNSPLRQDPAKLAAWQSSSRRRLAPQSKKRRSEAAERKDVRDAVFARDNYRCSMQALGGHRCGGKLGPHHLRKASQGGLYVAPNLLTVCDAGNVEIEDRPNWAWEIGLVIRNGQSYQDAQTRRQHAGLPWRLSAP